MCDPCGQGGGGENHSPAQIAGRGVSLAQLALRVTSRMFVPCPVQSVVCLLFIFFDHEDSDVSGFREVTRLKFRCKPQPRSELPAASQLLDSPQAWQALEE